MKFYSDVTKKLYDTEEELNAAELNVKTSALKAKEEERKLNEAIEKDIKTLNKLKDKYVAAKEEINKINDEIDKFIDNFIEKHSSDPLLIYATQIALEIEKMLDGYDVKINCKL